MKLKKKKTEVDLWGDGSPYREFLYSEDLATACVFLMESYDYKDTGEFLNVGCGEDLKIEELANLIAEIIGFKGCINWDSEKPNGTPRKLLDVSRLKALGWMPKISLREGVSLAYEDFLNNYKGKNHVK